MTRVIRVKKEVKVAKNCIIAEKGEGIEIPLPIGTICVSRAKKDELFLVTGEEFCNPRTLSVVSQKNKILIYFPRRIYPAVSEFLRGKSFCMANIMPRANTPYIFVITPVGKC